MNKALIFLSLSFFLFGFGCASHRHFIQKELSKEAAKYVRKKTDELLLKKGPPDLKGILSTGEQLWTYCSTKAGEQKSLTMTIGNAPSNTNALNLITLNGIAPHPIPLPSGERDRVRGPHVKEINAFVLIQTLRLGEKMSIS